MVKNVEGKIIHFDVIHERDRWTDTAWRHRPRLHSIGRQKRICMLKATDFHWTWSGLISTHFDIIHERDRCHWCVRNRNWNNWAPAVRKQVTLQHSTFQQSTAAVHCIPYCLLFYRNLINTTTATECSTLDKCNKKTFQLTNLSA